MANPILIDIMLWDNDPEETLRCELNSKDLILYRISRAELSSIRIFFVVNSIRNTVICIGKERRVNNDAGNQAAGIYVSDWFDLPVLQSVLGTEIELENHCPPIEEGRAGLNLDVQHKDQKMVISFQYDKRHLTEEHAADYVRLMKYAGEELLADRLPQFDSLNG